MRLSPILNCSRHHSCSNNIDRAFETWYKNLTFSLKFSLLVVRVELAEM